MTTMSPFDNPADWHFCTIKGVDSPPCKPFEVKRESKWDEKSGKGAQGAYATYVGQDLAKFSVTFLVWNDATLAAWDQFRPLLVYDPTKKTVQAFDFFHPSLEGLGIKSVVCKSIGSLVHEDNGLYTATCEFLEFRPPPPISAVSTPTTSNDRPKNDDGANAPAGFVPDPAVVAAQKGFEDMQDQAKAAGAT